MNEMIMQDLMVFFGLMTTLGCLTTVVLAVIRRRRELPGAAAALAPALAELAQRLERIEQGVETTAIEVERQAEGQRFTAALLADRNRPAVGGEGASKGRVVTPH